MAQGLSTYSVFKEMINHDETVYTLSQDEIEKVQGILLSMMDDIHEVCEEEDLTYVMSGGCALGSQRNGGFIPWDDDIDICMPRKDYDRFRSLFIQHFGDKYYVQEVRACEAYDLNFMKVRLNESVFREPLDPEPEKSGIFIDIFAIENVADNRILRKMQQLVSDGMQFICSCLRIRKKKQVLLRLAGDSGNAQRAIKIKALIAIPFSVIPFRRWLLWTEKVLGMNHREDSEYVAIPVGGKHFKGETYPRAWVFPQKEIEFSGHHYYVMNEVKKYLGKMFGPDWMTPPPEEERIRHALQEFRVPDVTGSNCGKCFNKELAGEKGQYETIL